MSKRRDTCVSLAHLYVVSFVVRIGDKHSYGSADVFLSSSWSLANRTVFESFIEIKTKADHCAITNIFYAGEKIRCDDQMGMIDSVRLDRGN